MSAVSPISPLTNAALPDEQSFSLVLGGPLYQLLRRARLEDSVEDHLLRRLLVICGILWPPMLILSAAEGAFAGGVELPFLRDIETHVRFLIIVPLILIAELVVHRRMQGIIAQFLERGLIPAPSVERFHAAIAAAMKLRNSVFAELALIAFVLTAGQVIRSDLLALNMSSWYAKPVDGVENLTGAGLWLTWVSNPIMQFLLLRWYFRIFIWARFLWHVSRLDLALLPTHPDRNGGLGFLGASAYALSPLLTAHGAALAGYAASVIFYANGSLASFKLEIVVLVVLMMILVIGPLTVFAPKILAAKRRGLREYGRFAAEYSRNFDRRWMRTADGGGEEALGSADIQSLADLDGAVSIIRSMTALPVGRDQILQLIVATIIPFAPLLLTAIPLEQLLDRIIGVVF
jgi:hypothetical protein